MDSLDKISVDVSTAFTENIEEATGLKITEAIKENLGTTPQSTYVSISSNNNEYAIEEIHIQLLNKDIDKKKQIEDLIRSISDENTNIKITEISK